MHHIYNPLLILASFSAVILYVRPAQAALYMTRLTIQKDDEFGTTAGYDVIKVNSTEAKDTYNTINELDDGGNAANAFAFAYEGKALGVDANASAHLMGFAVAIAEARIDATITPELPGEAIDFVAGMMISGQLAAEESDTSETIARVGFAISINDNNVFGRSGIIALGDGFPEPRFRDFPNGLVTFEFTATRGVPFQMTIEALAGARVQLPEDGGFGTASVNFSNTFTWMGIQRAVDRATGQEITDYALIDSEGVDWRTGASIAAVPEPSSFALFGFISIGGWFLTARPRTRCGA